jgi:hypothetical protein
MLDYHDRYYSFRINNRNSAVRERYGVMTLNGQWREL